MPTPATSITVTPPGTLSGQPGVTSAPFVVQPDGYLVTAVEPAGGDALDFTDTGLLSNTVYSERLKIIDGEGNLHITPVVTFRTARTVADVVADINAAGGGATGGTYKLFFYYGQHQTIVTAPVGTNIAAGQSPTGFLCTFWDDVMNPGAGNHMRPRTDINGSHGAPCLSTGEIMGAGLYLPGSVLNGVQFNGGADPINVSGTVNGQVPNPLLTNRGVGWSITSIQRYRPNTTMWRLGALAGANAVQLSGIENMPAMADSAVNGFALPVGANGTASPVLVTDTFAVSVPNAASTVGLNSFGDFGRFRFGRDLPWLMTSGVTGDQADGTRDFYLLDNDGGFTAVGDSNNLHSYGFGFMAGRMNRAQTTLLHDFTDSEPYTPWRDVRDIAYFFGDSEQEPLATLDPLDSNGDVFARTYLAHIIRGYKGRARIQRTLNGQPQYFTIALFARSGNRPDEWQAPYLRFVEECDFVNRPVDGVWVNFWEYRNSGSLAQNQAALLQAKGIDSRIRTLTYNIGYPLNANDNSSYVDATFVAAMIPTYAEERINIQATRRFDPTNWANRLGNSSWFTSDGHPSTNAQSSDEARWMVGFSLMYGQDMSAQTWELQPSADVVNLSSGSPTATPTWTKVNYLGATLTKTLAFASLNTGIATVDAVTGVITRVAAGRTAVYAWSTDGGYGLIDVVCS